MGAAGAACPKGEKVTLMKSVKVRSMANTTTASLSYAPATDLPGRREAAMPFAL